MANAIYPLFKEAILQASASSSLAGSGATGVYWALSDQGVYTYSATHQYYSSAVSGSVGTDQEIGSKTYTTGTFSGGNLTYTAVSGASVEALLGYVKNAGANTTWRLLVYLDTSQTGLPVTPNGGNITVTWSGSGIFTISDRKTKEKIKYIGDIGPAKIYEFNYRGSKQRQVGLMAQEVEQFAPAAVRVVDGCKRVDYAKAFGEALKLAA